MILNIFALLFVLGITFVHSMFGLYSGVINVFCCIAALAVAFGYYEPLNELLTGPIGLHPSYTEPLALVLLFVVVLLILRSASDMLLRGNMRVPMHVDWAGGAVCGFVNGQICVGVMVIGFLMLPWGGRALTFSRYERDPDDTTYGVATAVPPEQRQQDDRIVFRRNELWLRSDAFAAGLFSLLSGGSLRGDTAFASVYPDYNEWVFWSGNTVQVESLTAPRRDDNADGFESGLKVESWWEQKTSLTEEFTRYRKKMPDRDDSNPSYERMAYEPRPGSKLLGVRLTLRRASADRVERSAHHRFRPSMIRLVGDVEVPPDAREPRHYIPQVIGGADGNIGNNLRIVDLDNNFSLSASGDTLIDVYFEADPRFRPRFIEYRRHARAGLSRTPAERAPSNRLAAGESQEQRQDQARGAARWIDTLNREFCGGIDRLPFALRLDRLRTNLNVTLSGQLFASGRITGDRANLEAPAGQEQRNVEGFSQPDSGRVFQLQTRTREALSLPGQVMNFVGSITNQYYVRDRNGEQYPLIGYYAIVQRDGRDYLELVYLPDDPSFRQMLDFRDGNIRRDLQQQQQAVLGLIFIVPPDSEIVSLDTGGGVIEFGETFRAGR